MWVFCLSQDHQQIFVCNEIESWEDKSFLFQVVIKRLLNLVQVFIRLDEIERNVFPFAKFKNCWFIIDSFHSFCPKVVDPFEPVTFFGKLLVNVV